MKNPVKLAILFLCMIVVTTSCKKYLDTKSIQNLATPSTLKDLEAILNSSLINRGSIMLNGATDEYYYLYADYLSLWILEHQQVYTWEPQMDDYDDWAAQYRAAFYANTVLFELGQIEENDVPRRNAIRGSALFYRALAFYRVAQLYAPQYNAATAATDPGIALKLNADINEKSTRASVQATYDRILTDLQEALTLLPNNVPDNNIMKTRPTKAAVHGLLARVYLQMGDYAKAGENAHAALQIHDDLMDFNDITWVDTTAIPSFQLFNPEVIFHSMTDASPNTNTLAKVDTTLYHSYDSNDLRRSAYYIVNSDNTHDFKGSYAGNTGELFIGIAIDELMLIKAEAKARAGDHVGAMEDLNNLLRTRWRTENGVSTYVDQVASDPTDALTRVLAERKKELVYRELRWPDLRRLNKEPAYAITIKRDLDGQIYTLAPNDPRYTLLIPKEVIRLSGIPQNPR